MNINKKLFLALLLWLCAGPFDSHTRDVVNIDLDGTYINRFVWRGEMWTDDPVFWQTTTIRYKGFRSYNFFNIDLTDINNDKFECNEFDFIIDYTFSFDSFSIAPGVLHFSSPTDFFEPTTKITLEVKVDLLLKPHIRIRIDPEKTRGSYYILSFSHNVLINRLVKEIDFYGSLGASQPRYYRKYLDNDVTLTDSLVGMNILFNIGKGFMFVTLVEFTSLIDSSIRDVQEENNNKKDAITYGIRLSKSFEL